MVFRISVHHGSAVQLACLPDYDIRQDSIHHNAYERFQEVRYLVSYYSPLMR